MSTPFFAFEADFVGTLRCIPMVVRFNLDLCGVKLSLRAWSRFDRRTRATLAGMPVRTPGETNTYREHLCAALQAIGEEPIPTAIDRYPLWLMSTEIPEPILAKARKMGVVFNGPKGWQRLTSLQRFTLLKLTRGGHENANFVPALREFGLTR